LTAFPPIPRHGGACSSSRRISARRRWSFPAQRRSTVLDALAEEFKINVAVLNSSAETVKAMEGRSRRLGVGIDTGQWAQDGTNARDGVARVKDRLLYVLLRDRSARGANAQNVPLGKGVANLREFLTELERQDDREISMRLGGDGSPVVTTRVPIAMTLDTTGVVKAPADLFSAVSAFEDVAQPAYAANFLEFSRTRPIRFDVVTPARGETLSPPKSRSARWRSARESTPRFRTSRLQRRRKRASSS
jgi:hypothetical protein